MVHVFVCVIYCLCPDHIIMLVSTADRIDSEIDEFRMVGSGACKCSDSNLCRRTPDILTLRRHDSPPRGIDMIYGGWQVGIAICT